MGPHGLQLPSCALIRQRLPHRTRTEVPQHVPAGVPTWLRCTTISRPDVDPAIREYFVNLKHTLDTEAASHAAAGNNGDIPRLLVGTATLPQKVIFHGLRAAAVGDAHEAYTAGVPFELATAFRGIRVRPALSHLSAGRPRIQRGPVLLCTGATVNNVGDLEAACFFSSSPFVVRGLLSCRAQTRGSTATSAAH